jgi:HAD superfamily hydrolase (TIGR01509 family)
VLVPRIPVDLVIFDCDGVLVDSEPLSNTVLAGALTRAGLETTPEQAVATYKGLHIRDVLEHAEQALGARLPADFVPGFEDARAEAFQRELVAVHGAAETVAAIRAAGVAVCVASQGKRSKTELTLGLTGLRSLFAEDAVFSAHSVKRGKPHPDLFLHAARAMGATPDRTIVIEDTVVGVTAAVAAGMRVIGYGADSDPDALRAAGAEVIADLSELPGRLGLDGSRPDHG